MQIITYTAESDLEFYIVVRYDTAYLPVETTRAYKAIRGIK